jgi:hypothetical protein
MIDREKVLTVLRRRFPGASTDALAAAANAIVALPDEWEDVTALEPSLAAHLTDGCGDGCLLRPTDGDSPEYRLYRRRLR